MQKKIFSQKIWFSLFASTLPMLWFAGCTSSPHVIKSQVIASSDKKLSTPDWVLSPQVTIEEGQNFIFIYRMNLEGSARPDACVSMARTQAVGEMLKYIKSSITASGQVEELGASTDPSFSSLTAFLSQGNLSGAKVAQTYWEQTLEADSTGLRPTKRLLCAVQVVIDKAFLERQMRAAIEGAPGGNPEIREKLLEAQKNFIEHAGQTGTTQP